jgi:hypothetical protein
MTSRITPTNPAKTVDGGTRFWRVDCFQQRGKGRPPLRKVRWFLTQPEANRHMKEWLALVNRPRLDGEGVSFIDLKFTRRFMVEWLNREYPFDNRHLP